LSAPYVTNATFTSLVAECSRGLISTFEHGIPNEIRIPNDYASYDAAANSIANAVGAEGPQRQSCRLAKRS